MRTTHTSNPSAPTPAPACAVLLSEHSWYVHLPAWLLARDGYLENLTDELDWERPDITMFGKTSPQPRDTAVCGRSMDPATNYRVAQAPKPWVNLAALVRDLVNDWAHIKGLGWEANGLIANLYRGPNDSIGLHADDEPALGHDPIVASVTLGAPRDLRITSHHNTRTLATVRLGDGDLFVMGGAFQREFRHGINKGRHPVGPRLSLTFRRY